MSQVAFVELQRWPATRCASAASVKSGRESTYFFDAGLFQRWHHGRIRSGAVTQQRSSRANVEFDMLFGPAYQGISACERRPQSRLRSITDARRPFAFNRKEAKDHGEGGRSSAVHSQAEDVIVDDVISGRRQSAGPSSFDSRRGGQAPLPSAARARSAENAVRARPGSAVEEMQMAVRRARMSIITLAELIEALAEGRGALARISAEYLSIDAGVSRAISAFMMYPTRHRLVRI